MPIAPSNGIELCYETFGESDDPTMLLVMGLGSQMIHWPDDFCAALAGRGYQVVRFDNRDMGESTWFDGGDTPGVRAAIGGGDVAVPYVLADMADDAVGLLDHLGVDRAHVCGVSMGGMIAQTIAIRHPRRVASLTSVMSTTGDPDVGTPTSEAMSALMAPPAATREAYQDAVVHHAHVWGSPGLFDAERLRETAGRAWDRGYHPEGTARQLVAVVSSGSRSADLAGISVPTLVIHGTADTLVQPSGGERTAEVIPDAKLLVVEGMGHDLPPALWPQMIDAVAGHAAEHG
ncbi:MAG TPA: alpha/beta fold hydrolase [Acidimicrobiales bacterium]|nr:alpha/beta fold hydrolase [Acidimicrobiales bacterium]